MRIVVEPSPLAGIVSVPASKSHSLRAAIFATIADGKSVILSPLESPDADACLMACEALGAEVRKDKDKWTIVGTSGKLQTPKSEIDVGNSGITLRFITGVAASCSGKVTVTGDESIQTNRPMDHMIKMINDLGGYAKSERNNGYAPITVQGPVKGGRTEFQGQDSQPVSGTLIGSLLYEGPIEIKVTNAGEKPWIDLTLSWFKRLDLECEHENYEHYKLPGRQSIKGFEIRVPGDFSSAAFPLAAGLLVKGSKISLEGLDMEDPQGDKKIIEVLQEMGAEIKIGETLEVSPSELNGIEIDVNDFIDAVPILSVIGCSAKGKTVIKNAAIARKKESDRLSVMTEELKKMGAKIEESKDSLTIYQSSLKGATVNAHNDHRVALSLSVAGMNAEGKTIIEGAECMAKTFHDFPERMQAVGAKIRREE